MSENKGTKKELEIKGNRLFIKGTIQALEHAKKVWGIYFDDIDEDCNQSRGEISQKDYIAGYEQGLKDLKAPEMLEMLKEMQRRISIIISEPSGIVKDTMINNLDLGIEQLIKEATEI